jgi:protein SCO1/2
MNRGLKTGLSALCLSFSFLLPKAYGAAGAALPDSSLYQLKSEWVTDAGARIRLESLRGKPRVLTLFFGHCESSCPMVLASLKIMESYLPGDWGEKGGVVLVSLDPRRDDVESLAAYRKRMDLAPGKWTLLKGNEQDTRELAMALGVAYRKSQENGGMDHNAVVVILGADGRILKRHEGVADGKVLADEFRAAAYASGH